MVPYENDPTAQVHEGFYEAFNSIRGTMEDTVQQLVQQHPDWPIYVTGHSLVNI